jgi:predicted NAD/FAD-binding protein
MLRSIIRFNKNSVKDLETMNESTLLVDYLKSKNYSDYFINYYIIPMAASIWSTSPNFILEMPAIFFIRFFDNHGLLKITNRPQWWVIKNGSKQYVKKILDDFNGTIHLNTTINELKRKSNKVYIKINNDTKIFDAVVLATHSDQSLSIIKDLSDNEKNVLGKIKYQKNTALIHTDTSILPKRKKAWSSWNYLLDKNDNKVILTYNMNILQSLKSKKTYCVTLNNTDMINENKIIKKITYHHPLFTKESVYAQSQKNLICGVNNTYFCGAYWGNGFHEDGVNSALDVCKKFGIDL